MPELPAELDQLLSAADAAVYRAKRLGGDRLCLQHGGDDDGGADPAVAATTEQAR